MTTPIQQFDNLASFRHAIDLRPDAPAIVIRKTYYDACGALPECRIYDAWSLPHNSMIGSFADWGGDYAKHSHGVLANTPSEYASWAEEQQPTDYEGLDSQLDQKDLYQEQPVDEIEEANRFFFQTYYHL